MPKTFVRVAASPFSIQRWMVAGLLQAAAAAAVGAEAPAPALPCTGQSAVQVQALTRQVVVIGERHGSNEMPAFAGALVCDLAKAGQPVVLALELDGHEQEALNRVVEADEASAGRARETLLAEREWRSAYQDGRTSRAMLQLIDDLRKLRQAGARVGVLALRPNDNLRLPTTPSDLLPLNDADNQIVQHGYDRVMADNLVYAAVLYRQFRIVALVGAGHTSTVQGSQVAPDWEPMGRIVDRQVPTTFIGIRTDGGTVWGFGARSGPYTLKAAGLYDPDGRIDIVVPIGRVTASEPAVPGAGAAP